MWRLKSKIVTIFILLNVPFFAGIVGHTYFSNRETAIKSGEKVIAHFQSGAVHSIHTKFSAIRSLVSSAATIAGSNTDFFVSKAGHPFLQSLVANEPEIVSAYSGLKDGTFIQSRRVNSREKSRSFNISEEARFSDRTIKGAASAVNLIEHNVFRDLQRNYLGEHSVETKYDPRTRGWYKNAIDANNLITTDPYVFASLGQIGYTVAAPFFQDGLPEGVVALDITLDVLSAELSERKLSTGTQTYLLTQSGLVVASSEGAFARIIKGSELELPHISSLKDALPGIAFSDRPIGQDKTYVVYYEGEEFLATISSLKAETGKEWQIFTVTPLNDFVRLFDKHNMQLLALGICSIFLQLLIVLALSGRMARPLEQLAVQVAQIQSFKNKRSERVRTSVKEIASLSSAVHTLGTAISSFSSYVPTDLVEKLVESNQEIKLGGRTQFLTVFFCDIEGFSTLSEETPSPDLMKRLSNYFQITTEAIETEKGTTDKFIGDGVMAFWGAPVHVEEHAWHACVASVRVQRRMDELNTEWSLENKPALNVRIGLHSDAVLVGNIGSELRLNYTVMGDGVNIAARLEGTNKDYNTKICISHSVFREAGDRLCTRPIEDVTVKGRRSKIPVYELLGVFGTDDPSLAPSEGDILLARRTEEAYSALRKGSFENARRLYQAIIEDYPNDGVASAVLKKIPSEGHS
jgi:adenylate cyclase